MKVVLCPNALKGSLSACDAATALAEGVLRAVPSANIVSLPVADGGDGTRAVLSRALGGDDRESASTDALGRPITGAYTLIEGGRTAIIDVATASGLARLTQGERDALRASSFGTGELLRAALNAGCQRVLLGVGGSASVDGGKGVCEALGVRFLDAEGRCLLPGGGSLERLARIDTSQLLEIARAVEFVIACDVDNPLLGLSGAAAVFAPQKGADAKAVVQLSRGLERLCALLDPPHGESLGRLPKGGAAGGMAATLSVLLGAELLSGIDWVLDALGFEEHLQGAALVITAEGRLDAQSLQNKGPYGVARRALAAGVPTLVLAGALDPDLDLSDTPFIAALPIIQEPMPLERARERAAAWLAGTAEQALRLFVAGGSRQ